MRHICFWILLIFSPATAGLAYMAPMLVGYDHITPATMLLYCTMAPAVYYGAPFIAVLWMLLTDRTQWHRWLLIGGVIVGISAAHVAFLSAKERDQRFLDVFSKRVVMEAGLKEVMDLFIATEKRIKLDPLADARIRSADIPEPIRKLYRHCAAYGYADFSNNKLMRLRVFYGGPSYRWGIEVLSGKLPQGGVEKFLEKEVSEDVSCFIAK